MWTLVYVMITSRFGFLLTPIRMTLNDLARPMHLKVRLADSTLDVRMLYSRLGTHIPFTDYDLGASVLSLRPGKIPDCAY